MNNSMPELNNYFYTKVSKEDKDNKVDYSKNTTPRLQAEGTVSTVRELSSILKDLTNAAWGSRWGTLSPDIAKGENSRKILVPQINLALNLREVSEKTPHKPRITDVMHEAVNGIETGDIYRVFRQTFDCIIEFNVWGENSLECDELCEKFEELLFVYTGYLKQRGVSEIFFLKEVPAKYSLRFDKDNEGAMRCLYYYVRLERARQVRTDDIKSIEMKLHSKQ